MIALTIFLIISGVVTQAILQMTNSQRTIWNRTQMHAGVRSATELLQQEIGQAGRISLPYPTRLAAGGPYAAGGQTIGLEQFINNAWTASVKGVFVGEQITVDAGEDALGNTLQETVQLTAVSTAGKTVTGTFLYGHNGSVPVIVLGGFASGIVPLAPGYANGSTATTLKLYGDINGDGNMQYVEYVCDTVNGRLYRNSMPFDQTTAKTAPTSSQILLNNILPNPDGTGCFTYEPTPLQVVGTDTYVLDVAITLTVQTQIIDPTTNTRQTETKALLNVSPRNVFNVWQLASSGFIGRVQPIPPTVQALLP
jgi:hypothetical protein